MPWPSVEVANKVANPHRKTTGMSANKETKDMLNVNEGQFCEETGVTGCGIYVRP
jgi:hypothetical protein